MFKYQIEDHVQIKDKEEFKLPTKKSQNVYEARGARSPAGDGSEPKTGTERVLDSI